MKTSRTLPALCIGGAIALAAACQPKVPTAAPTPVAVAETPCWWTVYRSGLPVDTVAAHLVNAFTALGLGDATFVRHGDTAWAKGGPTRIAARYGGRFSARAVALQRGDSTLYRYFVTAEPPPGGWRKGYDSVTVNNTHISVNPASSGLGLCTAIASRAQNGGKAPKEPNGEEAWAVWSSRMSAAGSSDALAAGAAPAPGPGVVGTSSTATTAIVLRPVEPAKADSIVLERTPCFGVCQAYRLRVAKSGEVSFRSHTARDTTPLLTSIPAEVAQRLFERANVLGFDELPDTIATNRAYCPSYVTDFPSAVTTVFVGARSKQVIDYLGCDWAPVGLRNLETLIDSTAGTARLMRLPATR